LDSLPKNIDNVDLLSKLIIIDREKSNVEPEDLYKILSDVNFFLCFPGVVMPLCHNVVEAMGFGCIPILQYPDLFHPPLINGVNCLSFSDEQTLLSAISKARNLREPEIEIVRKNVIEYYNSYLDPKAMVKNLVEARGVHKNVFIIAESNSVKILASRFKASNTI